MKNTALHFWFNELEPKQWFVKDESLDQEITERFTDLHQQAVQGELWSWRDSAKGRLAEIIVLDQFSRNMYRDQPQSFAADGMALLLAQEAIALGLDKTLEPKEQSFLYMPFMHSESKVIHEKALKLFSQPGLEYNLTYEEAHKKIIDRFGRYPHRNAILGRASTEEEIAFLKEPGSSF